MAAIRENNGDASADTGTTYTISLGDTFNGTLDTAEDKDWIKVELTAGIIYDFTLSGVESAELYLADSGGYLIVFGGVTPSGAKLIYSPKITDTYYIHIGSTASDYSGEYELSLVENTIPEGTYDEIADYLTDGYWEWAGGAKGAFHVEPGGVLTADITVLTEAGQQLARWAFEAWTNVTGIQFEFVEDSQADILFETEPDITASAGPVAIRNGLIISSEVNIPPDYVKDHGTTIDSFSFYAFMHEIGHALGLGHAGPYPTDNDNPVATYGVENIYLIDSYQASIMSYIHQAENTYVDASFAYNVTPMISDIIAIQNLYGAPVDINAGDTVYGYRSNLDGYLGEFFKLWAGETNPFILVNVDITDFTSTPDFRPVLNDLDADGDFDLIVGTQTGSILYFENTGTAIEPIFTERNGTDNPLNSVTAGSYSEPALADLDGDGDPDLIVGNGFGELYYFENTGADDKPSYTRRTGVANPLDDADAGSYSKPALADLDNDGDLDLLVGNDSGEISYFENTGTPNNPAFSERTGVDNPLENINVERHSASSLADLDGDGDLDLVIWGWYGTVKYFENIGTESMPSFAERTGVDNLLDDISFAPYSIPTFVDLDDDSDLDLVIADWDGVIRYFMNLGSGSNPDFSATHLGQPVALTLYDNDGNDTLDLRTDRDDQRVYLRQEGISDVYGLTGNLVIARNTVIENFVAGFGNDLVVGNAVANHINGGGGNDRIWGSRGDDILAGGPGADTLTGGPGADMLDGGSGSDTASYQNSPVAVLVRLHNARAVKYGDAEGDTLVNIEHIIGSDHNDTLAGDGEDNVLKGGGGNDDMYGGPAGGDDDMYGDAGDDRIFGGRGDDTLTGGEGSDVLKGGPGEDILIVDGDEMDVLFGGPDADTFRFFPSDLGGGSIRDFTDGEDMIDLTQFSDVNSIDDLDIVSYGDNVRIELTGADYLTTIILSDFDMGNLDNSDFMV